MLCKGLCKFAINWSLKVSYLGDSVCVNLEFSVFLEVVCVHILSLLGLILVHFIFLKIYPLHLFSNLFAETSTKYYLNLKNSSVRLFLSFLFFFFLLPHCIVCRILVPGRGIKPVPTPTPRPPASPCSGSEES